MNNLEYWENLLETGDLNPDDQRYAMEGLMSAMVDEGLCSMGWGEDEEIVFFMTDKQKKFHDWTHPG